jgi:hypothetical protein
VAPCPTQSGNSNCSATRRNASSPSQAAARYATVHWTTFRSFKRSSRGANAHTPDEWGGR